MHKYCWMLLRLYCCNTVSLHTPYLVTVYVLCQQAGEYGIYLHTLLSYVFYIS
jgi:hypothetical protein